METKCNDDPTSLRFLSNVTPIQEKLKNLCVERYRSPGDFIEFGNTLMSLGVIRQTYDVLNDEIIFYSGCKKIYHLSASEINQSIYKGAFQFGGFLNSDRLKKAIADFDSNKLSIVDFHRVVAESGVVYVSVYLKQRKIYYLGQDGEYFLESY